MIEVVKGKVRTPTKTYVVGEDITELSKDDEEYLINLGICRAKKAKKPPTKLATKAVDDDVVEKSL